MKFQYYSLQSTIGLKTSLRTPSWKYSERKRCSKFRKLQETFCKTVSFPLKFWTARICDSTKTDPKKNVSCECSKISANLPEKGLYWSLFLTRFNYLETTHFFQESIHRRSQKQLFWKFWKTSCIAIWAVQSTTYNYTKNGLHRKWFLWVFREFLKLLKERLWWNYFLLK